MKHSQNYERAKQCVDTCVTNWNKTTLSDIEKYSVECWVVYGMVKAFLYFLNFTEYNDIKEYIYTEYGFNVGGTSGDRYEED